MAPTHDEIRKAAEMFIPEFMRVQPKRVKVVYRWQNDMVMTFDSDGEQIPELQGKYSDVRDAVLAASEVSTDFRHGTWRDDAHSVTREEW